MPLTSFCGLLTLQIGAAILGGVFFTLAGVILAANIFDYHSGINGWPISLILMLIFVIGLIVAGALMIASSYSDRRPLALGALLLIIILLLYWLILCFLSFLSYRSHVRAVCISTRCPESFWLANLMYRSYHQDGYKDVGAEGDEDETDEPTKRPDDAKGWWPEWGDAFKHKKDKRQITNFDISNFLNISKNLHLNVSSVNKMNKNIKFAHQKGVKNFKLVTDKIKKYLASPIYIDNNSTIEDKVIPVLKVDNDGEKEKEDKDEGYYIFGFPLIGAIMLFIINLIFLLFSALIMWSWASELDYADYYIEDEDSSDSDDEPQYEYEN